MLAIALLSVPVSAALINGHPNCGNKKTRDKEDGRGAPRAAGTTKAPIRHGTPKAEQGKAGPCSTGGVLYSSSGCPLHATTFEGATRTTKHNERGGGVSAGSKHTCRRSNAYRAVCFHALLYSTVLLFVPLSFPLSRNRNTLCLFITHRLATGNKGIVRRGQPIPLTPRPLPPNAMLHY